MKTILLFGAGKSATVLIDYLLREAPGNGWTIIIADASLSQIIAKTNHSDFAEAVEVDITDDQQRARLVQRADIVISMMPPGLHFLVAQDCVASGKNLLTASYLDDRIRGLQGAIASRGLLFICEMGLDPGIDHMSAMKILDRIRAQGGVINSFKSHCGGLVAPESDDNPWRYKISWNPRNVVNAGKAGAEYKIGGKIHQQSYSELFQNCATVKTDGLDGLAIYPNRDSLSYLPVYKLENVATFLRTTLRYPGFCKGWDALVRAGLTDDRDGINPAGLTLKKWADGIAPFVNRYNEHMLGYLGLFDDAPVPATAASSADILQYLLETRLAMQPHDRDMIVMLHEIGYSLDGREHMLASSLVVKGEDYLRTAMAKTVGLPLGIAAKLILNGTISLKGLHIPTVKEIYEPVLAELQKAGILFTEKHL